MSSFEDYEVLSILGTNSNSTCYKVKNKLTSEVFIWKAINYETYSKQTIGVLEKINARKSQQHSSLIHFYDHIVHEETHTVYLVIEYCKYGSLANIIQKCVKQNEFIEELLIWQLLYKLAHFCKIHESNQVEYLNIHDTFIDVEGNVKILNFTLNESTLIAEMNNIQSLGILLHQIVFLNVHYQQNTTDTFPEYYSNDLHNLLKFLTNPEPDVAPTIDAVLYHPMALLKQVTDRKYALFVQKNPTNSQTNDQRNNCEEPVIVGDCHERNLHLKLENLRRRDAQLKGLELKLQEREHDLSRREKKIALMERIAKEKISRAELYLKRSRDYSNKPCTQKTTMPRTVYEKQDTSFSADCGDSIIVPTSRKLNVKDISKPAKFTRTMSERRVRFKSHSPLKEIHHIKRELGKSQRMPDLAEIVPALKKLELAESDKASETSDKTSAKHKKKFGLSAMFMSRKTKKPNSIASSSDSVSAHTYEDLDKGWEDFRQDIQDCKPINWAENAQNAQVLEQTPWNVDAKKQAFDLLRIMNHEEVDEIKHTFL